MNTNKSLSTEHQLPRQARWPYWVFVPIVALSYSAFCTWFLLEAWGRRGEPKPNWFDVASVFAIPRLFLVPIPIIGPFVVGGSGSFLLIWFAQRLQRGSLSKR
ncbi:hypothetical protein CA13_11680 [Planctomycetes bacterium CA13]|uniref:Uncharacterized protein n=1 Tax=Novipirellula herctigrandis TaxID=2527986 RepID=A0A5C5YYT2_9BACT|nr:hypothetical protein CA13_11680 [Planctomycetes bacterium CA13]